MNNEPWSVSISDWNKVSPELREIEWKRVRFNVAAKDLIKPVRGIYIVTMKVPGAADNHFLSEIVNPIYIGHSTNLQQRFVQHTSGKAATAIWRRLSEVANFCSFNYCRPAVQGVDELKHLEQQLINCFGKQLNKINSVAQGAPLIGRFERQDRGCL